MDMKNPRSPIAIVGMACRTPGGATSPDGLWQVLLDRIDGVGEVPSDRWQVDEYYDPDSNKAGMIKTRRGGFIDGIDQFDAEFFNIFPTEAERMDPQQRMLLMATFEAIEDAGDPLARVRGSRTAVYMGTFMNDYWDLQVDPSNRFGISPHVPMGSSLTSIANRISYLYDLRGPSISLDTACSSSLVAVHLACQGLWRGDSSAAIAGGVNLMINPESTVMMSKGNFLSPDGACKSFDASGNGYVRSEGVGLVYLKPLEQALADGNRIYGLIRSTACNSDGFTPEGFTVPSADAQQRMLETAYREAGVAPAKVQYIEAHGTGTPVGDPLETRAFGAVFSSRPAEQPLLIGSVKSNIGHLEGAAGVTGLIKLALSMQRKTIPGNLHFTSGNPKIDFVNWRLQVVDRTRPWPEPVEGGPRIGGVNSFGAGGTNAHLVLEEYRAPTATGSRPRPRNGLLFSCSAQTEGALRELLSRYRDGFADPGTDPADLCHAAGRHRSLLRHRIAIAASEAQDLVAKIEAYLDGRILAGVELGIERDRKSRLGFVFTGQGPQWHAMGRQLIAREAVFRNTLERIEALFRPLAGWSLLEELGKDEADSRISDTRIAQPAIMAVQIGLVELWRSHGIEPDGVVGHSIGEVAAAYTAGALTLEQAVQVIYHRSRGQHQATGAGLMLAVGVDLDEARRLIAPHQSRVSIGAVNGPRSITLSGDAEPLQDIAAQLGKREIFNRFLKVNVPFHSHHMEPLKDELIASLQDLHASPARLPLYSTVSGRREDGLHLNSAYWYANVRDPVYFSPAMERMLDDGFDLFVEIGPHPTLSSGAEELFTARTSQARILPSIRRKEDEQQRFLQTLGALLLAGVPLDWDRIYPGAHRPERLPRYPWQLQRYWAESPAHRRHRLGRRLHPNILHHRAAGSASDRHDFDILLDRAVDPYLDDHRVDDIIIFPATGHLELATAAARAAFGERFGFVEDVSFDTGLFLPDSGQAPEIRLEVDSDEGRYRILSRERDDVPWVRHSSGRMNCLGDGFQATKVDLAALQERINDRLPVQPMYNDLKQSGLAYGPTFRIVHGLWTAPGEILGRISLHEGLVHGIGAYQLHPSVLDACLHTIFAAKMIGPEDERGVFLPVHVDRYRFFKQPRGRTVWSHVRIRESSSSALDGDFIILDEDGSAIAELQGLHCKHIAGSRREDADPAYAGSYGFAWREAPEANLKPVAKVEAVLVIDRSWDPAGLLAALTGAGMRITTLGEGPGVDRAVDLNDREAVVAAFAALRRERSSLNRIILALPLGCVDAERPDRAATELSWRVLNVHAALIAAEYQAVLWSLTLRVEVGEGATNLAQSPIQGLSRVLTNEWPMTIAKVVDFSAADPVELASFAELAASTSHGGNETVFAIRGGTRLVRRLERSTRVNVEAEQSRDVSGSGGHYEAYFSEPGILDSVRFRRFLRPALAADAVEIAVRASALNFKDVLNGMGLLSAESVAGGLVGAQLGLECSGVVTRIGSAVTRFAAGDEVVAIAPRSLAGTAVSPEHCVVGKPSHLSHAEAATLTIVYLTAYHCLYDLARLEAGERVLIHSGTGGVGIAAIRLAKLIGADIYATAGSEQKRQMLRDMGVAHVYDSRSLAFHDQIRADTGGEGVDVVLNSLSGKAIVQSIKCLRPFGRFVEIGKTDIYADVPIHLKRFGENLSYHAVDVDRLMAQRPAKGARLFADVIRLFEERRLDPHPFTAFPITRLAEALDYVAKGRHVGKVVLTMEGETVRAAPPAKLVLDPATCHLITGGASGLGIELALWLVARGARCLALVSRSGPKTAYDRHVIASLREQGVRIILPQADLTREDEVRRAVAEARSLGPIGGVIHSAAILRDGTVQNLTREAFDQVFAAKAVAGWNLHRALDGEPLAYFVSISSISAVFGLPGQSNYSGANNFLDRLVDHRRSLGLPAQSIQLGVLGQFAGMSREGGKVLHVLDSQGWTPMTITQVTTRLERTILDGAVTRMAANLDWQRFRDFFPHLRTDLTFAHLLSDEALNLGGGKPVGDGLRDRLLALVGGEAQQLLVTQLSEALARILGTTADRIDPVKPVSAIGLDSLMMNQLRNWIQQKLEVNYPLMRMAKGPSIDEIAAQLRDELGKGAAGPATAATDASGITSEADLEMVNGWFLHRRIEGSPPARPKLFLFHSMGAGASMFAHFMYNPPAEWDVHCVQLPGRENRSSETAYTDLQPLLADLEKAMLPLMDGDFAFYGHSYGGIIAFEMARLLRRKHRRQPCRFFASATMAPQMTLTWKNRDVMRESTISSNSELKLIGLMSYIDDLDFVKKILPGMRRDMPLLMGYDYREDEPLSCPITVFSAIEDEVTLVEEMAQWKVQTSAAFRQELVHGDHWFVSRNKEFIAGQLAHDLAEGVRHCVVHPGQAPCPLSSQTCVGFDAGGCKQAGCPQQASLTGR